MGFLFQFTDVPKLGDVWETELDIDVAIHTRPALVAERDRFAREYGIRYAREELRGAVIRGLKDFGYQLIPRIQDEVHQKVFSLRGEARADAVVANGAIDGYWVDEKDYRRRERELLEMALDSPEATARFVRELAPRLDDLDPVERMRGIFALLAASIGERIPYAEDAPELLADAFGGPQTIPRLNDPADLFGPEAESTYEMAADTGVDTLAAVALASQTTGGPLDEIPLDASALCDEVVADIMEGLSARLVEDEAFLDGLIEEWVLHRIAERFDSMDERIDELASMFAPDSSLSREDFITMESDPEWVELAAELGSPLPEDAPGMRPDAE